MDSELIVAGPQEKVSSDKLLPHIGTFAGQLAERWRANPPDLADAHGWIAGLAALAAARDLGIPVGQTSSWRL